MDNKTTIEDLKNAVSKFICDREWDPRQNCKDVAIDIVNEANELLEIFCWKSEWDITQILKDEKKMEHIREELADVLYGVCSFAYFNNIDLASSLYDKLEKTARKYPIDKCKGSNKKYTEL